MEWGKETQNKTKQTQKFDSTVANTVQFFKWKIKRIAQKLGSHSIKNINCAHAHTLDRFRDAMLLFIFHYT